ncbi:unnamed protein product [Chrysoparadoxa australica]
MATLRYMSWNGVILGSAHQAFGNLPLGTLFYNTYLKAMGSSVGDGAVILEGVGLETDLLSVGAGAVINAGVKIPCHGVEQGKFVLSRPDIGAKSEMGSRAAVLAGAEVGAGSTVSDLSLVMKGERTGGRVWAGLPVHRCSNFFFSAEPEQAVEDFPEDIGSRYPERIAW